MPVALPLSELQRNMGTVVERCHEAKQPICLTENGKASFVVMDAAEFDSHSTVLKDLCAHEERVERASSRGYDDLLNGRAPPLDQVLQNAKRIRGA